MSYAPALDGHVAVSFDSSCLVGHSIDIGELYELFQWVGSDPQSFSSAVVEEIFHHTAVKEGFFDRGPFHAHSERDVYFLYVTCATRSLCSSPGR